jgi:hypothetical protein
MARPRTKSDHIPVRLPLAVYATVEQLAAARGETVPQWIERKITAAVDPQVPAVDLPRRPPSRTSTSRTTPTAVVPRFKPGRTSGSPSS